jgi:hypothetical protein
MQFSVPSLPCACKVCQARGPPDPDPDWPSLWPLQLEFDIKAQNMTVRQQKIQVLIELMILMSSRERQHEHVCARARPLGQTFLTRCSVKRDIDDPHLHSRFFLVCPESQSVKLHARGTRACMPANISAAFLQRFYVYHDIDDPSLQILRRPHVACRNVSSCGLQQHSFLKLAAAATIRSCGLPHSVQCGLPQHEFERLAAACVRAACRSNEHALVRLAALRSVRLAAA